MKKKHLLLLALVSILSSCSTKHDLDSKYSFSLKAKDSIKINFNDSISLFFPGEAWNYDDNGISFTTLKTNNIEINTYTFNTKTWEKTIKLNLEGPNGIKNQGGFQFINDSLIYSTAGYSRYGIYNKNGEPVLNNTYGKREVSFNIKEWSPKFYFKNNVLGFSSAEYEATSSQEKTYDSAKLYTLINLKNGTPSYIINYPDEFKNNIWSSNDNSYTAIPVGDTIIFNFSKSHYLYLYDLKGNLLAKKEARDKLIKEAKPMIVNDPQKNSLSHEINGHYNNLIYDKYRKLYYRTSIGYNTKEENISPSENSLMSLYRHKKLCVTTLNENLDIIAQDYFLGRQGGLGDVISFVREDGLYLWLLYKEKEKEEIFIRFNLEKK